ncbi:hypothetical protein M513_02485 [Trichuris suis]|uniref:Uncharacterized protein n=1 Tax=Trichuris suis TaxID=68888 RepID=A0A085MHW2_9BILA|nr:hypothetical protein M513_02485 [Trichuris suis]
MPGGGVPVFAHVQDAHDVHDLKGRRDTCEGVFPNEDANICDIARHPRCPLVESPDGCRSLAVPATWPTRRTTLVSSSAKNENVLVLSRTPLAFLSIVEQLPSNFIEDTSAFNGYSSVEGTKLKKTVNPTKVVTDKIH